MPVYKIPEAVYAEFLLLDDYKKCMAYVSTLHHVVPILRKALRTQLVEGKKNREEWRSDTKKFKSFLEKNKKYLTNINVTVGEMNFIFIKEVCHIVKLTTTKGEFTFTISMAAAGDLLSNEPNVQGSVANQDK